MADEFTKVLWYYNLLPDTSEAKIVCPFHNDNNPSMIVNLNTGSYYCFGCGKAGDAKSFVFNMEKIYNNSNDLKAMQTYYKILKSKKCSNISVKASIKRSKKKPNKILYAEAYDYYHGLSKVNWRKPKIDEVKDALSYMEKRGFNSYTLNKCGAKVTYNNQYGLIFPMLDNKKFKGWVCRTMRKDIESRRKYLYNEGFSRANTLVGDYGSEKYVFVVEGYMDRLKFIQYGVDNVVAILGWKMSIEQSEKLKAAGVTHIISALDNDDCGKKGTQYLKTLFKVTRFQYLKGIKDPGEMSENVFKKCYNKTMKIYNNGIKKRKEDK